MRVSRHLIETKQQLVCVQQTRVSGLQSGVQSVTVVAKLVAALHDESHGEVVTGRKLVTVKDDDLSSRHHLLTEPTEDGDGLDTTYMLGYKCHY